MSDVHEREMGITATVTSVPKFSTVTNGLALPTNSNMTTPHAALWLDQQGSAEQEQQARVSLNPDVTAHGNNTGRPSGARGKVVAPRSGDTGYVALLGATVSLDSETGRAFVTDCARHTEGLRTDQELKQAWGLDDQQWARLADNMPLLLAIQAERTRRICSGEAAREAAQRAFAGAPSILSEILQNKLISPRARIEAARELRHVAANGPETSAAAEKFVIHIDLGGDDKFVLETEIVSRPPTTEEEEW